MKRDCWLLPNRRALGVALIVPAIVATAAIVAVVALPRGGWPEPLYWLAWFLLAVSIVAAATLLQLARLPRLGFQDDHLLVYLRGFQPHRVPIELVECFFLGQGPSYMPPRGERPSETSTIVVRLAESAHDWRRIDVRPTLGHWCDGYITIRGTWCEPIDATVMKRLNDRLIAAHRQRRSRPQPQPQEPT